MMREADKQGVKILALPELCLTGYTCGAACPDGGVLASGCGARPAPGEAGGGACTPSDPPTERKQGGFSMKDGFICVAAGTPQIRVADCRYNAEQIFIICFLPLSSPRPAPSLVAFCRDGGGYWT